MPHPDNYCMANHFGAETCNGCHYDITFFGVNWVLFFSLIKISSEMKEKFFKMFLSFSFS